MLGELVLLLATHTNGGKIVSNLTLKPNQVREYVKVDWKNKESVIRFALALGAGMTVYKKPDRRNFNITQSVRKDIIKPAVAEGAIIVYET
jgi:hypothetical protein